MDLTELFEGGWKIGSAATYPDTLNHPDFAANYPEFEACSRTWLSLATRDGRMDAWQRDARMHDFAATHLAHLMNRIVDLLRRYGLIRNVETQ